MPLAIAAASSSEPLAIRDAIFKVEDPKGEVVYAGKAGFAKALEGLDALEGEIQIEQRATAQPKPHKFELKPKS